MEKLIVDNFLNLKHIELDVAKINIIIGRQAQGKSVLAKLVYFFKEFIPNFHESILRLDSSINNKMDKINGILLNLFKQIFPNYSWQNQSFTIKYYCPQYRNDFPANKMFVTINNKVKREKNNLSLSYSQELSQLLESAIQLIHHLDIDNMERGNKQKLEKANLDSQSQFYQSQKIDKSIKMFKEHPQTFKYMKKMIVTSMLFDKFNLEKNIFIPSVRSFFIANISKNIFSFLSNDISIDYFSRELGAIYEQAKNNYLMLSSENKKERLEINKIISKILKGNYLREQDQDWIIHENNRKVRLSDASSGQQEALPITLILSVLPFLENDRPYHFFIEEPEAHLFPDAQKYMIDLFSLVFNLTEQKNGFFITTHSPYILTAFNNLIQAGNARKKIAERGNKPEEVKKLYSIISEDKILDIEDFGVYTLENGELKSIIDEENRLIDENIIDEISDEIGDIFDKLVDLELGEE